jgi:hypothetical protein
LTKVRVYSMSAVNELGRKRIEPFLTIAIALVAGLEFGLFDGGNAALRVEVRGASLAGCLAGSEPVKVSPTGRVAWSEVRALVVDVLSVERSTSSALRSGCQRPTRRA